jgi:hypothetical protein
LVLDLLKNVLAHQVGSADKDLAFGLQLVLNEIRNVVQNVLDVQLPDLRVS